MWNFFTPTKKPSIYIAHDPIHLLRQMTKKHHTMTQETTLVITHTHTHTPSHHPSSDINHWLTNSTSVMTRKPTWLREFTLKIWYMWGWQKRLSPKLPYYWLSWVKQWKYHMTQFINTTSEVYLDTIYIKSNNKTNVYFSSVSNQKTADTL